MIGTICNYPEIVMGAAGLVGAIGMATVSVIKKKKEDKKFKFEINKIIDTIWQSTAAGYVAGMALSCGYAGILIAMVTGYGVDKIANRLSVNKTQLLNIVGMVANYLESKDKR